MLTRMETEVGPQVKLTPLKKSGTACSVPTTPSDPALDALVNEIIGRVADKWTMLVLETLEEHGRLRFTRLSSQSMFLS